MLDPNQTQKDRYSWRLLYLLVLLFLLLQIILFYWITIRWQ